jgi:hypothetical protein
MSLITIRTSSTRVDAYLSGIFAMAESVLAKDDGIDSREHWFTVTIDQGDDNVNTNAEVLQDQESEVTDKSTLS